MAARRTPPQRRAALRHGMHAELAAAVALSFKFYRVLAWRYRGGGGEIDLVVRRGRTVAFVEVKARADLDTAVLAIGTVKQERLARAVRHWLVRNPWASGLTLRCDAVLVAPRCWPRHVPDAFPLPF
jgi:putative endonuclease